MVEHNIRLLEDRRSKFKKFVAWIKTHKEEINVATTIILIIVTLVLIGVTVQSINVANNLGKIQVNIQKFQEKKETLEQITLAVNVREEILINKVAVNNIKTTLMSIRESTKFITEPLEITKVDLALEQVGFGNKNIIIQLRGYKKHLSNVQLSLELIEETTETGDDTFRDDYIGNGITYSENFLIGAYTNFNLDTLLTELQTYIDERQRYYGEIDKEIEEELLLDLKN